MKNVEVLLRESVPNLGRVGDVVRVASGYARNYLFPHRIAVTATKQNVASMQRRAAIVAAEEAAKLADAQGRADALAKVVLKTRQKADENGHLYGSVNTGLVASLLSDFGYQVEEKDVRLDAPIKLVGEHKVPVHVLGELMAEVAVIVEADE